MEPYKSMDEQDIILSTKGLTHQQFVEMRSKIIDKLLDADESQEMIFIITEKGADIKKDGKRGVNSWSVITARKELMCGAGMALIEGAMKARSI